MFASASQRPPNRLTSGRFGYRCPPMHPSRRLLAMLAPSALPTAAQESAARHPMGRMRGGRWTVPRLVAALATILPGRAQARASAAAIL